MSEGGNILVFGAYGFVGQAWCSYLESHGYRVLKGGRRPEQSPDVLLDFSEPEQVESIQWDLLPQVDGITFLQGIDPHKGIHDIQTRDFRRMLDVNLTTPSLVIQKLLPKLRDHASITFVSSVARRKGSYDPSYAAAKSGLVGLMHSLANACAAQRVNALSLGLVEGSPVYEGMTEDFRAKHRSKMWSEQLITLEQVVNTLAFIHENLGIHREILALEGGYQA